MENFGKIIIVFNYFYKKLHLNFLNRILICKYDRVLNYILRCNYAGVLNIPKLRVCQVCACESVAQSSEYVWIWQNNALWQGSEYAWPTFCRVLIYFFFNDKIKKKANKIKYTKILKIFRIIVKIFNPFVFKIYLFIVPYNDCTI